MSMNRDNNNEIEAGSDDAIRIPRDNNEAMRRNQEQIDLVKARIDLYNRNYYDCVDEIGRIMWNIRVLSSRWTGNIEITLRDLFRSVKEFDDEIENQTQVIRNSEEHNRVEFLLNGLYTQYYAKLRLSNDLKAQRELLNHEIYVSSEWQRMIRDAEGEYARLRRSP